MNEIGYEEDDVEEQYEESLKDEEVMDYTTFALKYNAYQYIRDILELKAPTVRNMFNIITITDRMDEMQTEYPEYFVKYCQEHIVGDTIEPLR